MAVKVVGMDSDVAPDARSVFVNQVTTQLVGENQVESIGKQIGYKGEIAILSATANATNQNAWIDVMKETLKQDKYKDMKLVKIAYGDDDDQKSFQEMQGLIQAYPGPQGRHLPDDRRRRRRRALPLELAAEGQGQAHRPRLPEPDAQVRQGRHGRRVPALGPKDVGYLAGQAAVALVSGRITGKEGEKFEAGRLGEYTIGANGEIVLGPLTTFDKNNIDDFDF